MLTVRISEATKVHLEVLAQLNKRSVNAESCLALEAWVERSKSDPETRKRAEEAREEIEREAETRRKALEAVLGTQQAASPATKGPRAKPAGSK